MREQNQFYVTVVHSNVSHDVCMLKQRLLFDLFDVATEGFPKMVIMPTNRFVAFLLYFLIHCLNLCFPFKIVYVRRGPYFKIVHFKNILRSVK